MCTTFGGLHGSSAYDSRTRSPESDTSPLAISLRLSCFCSLEHHLSRVLNPGVVAAGNDWVSSDKVSSRYCRGLVVIGQHSDIVSQPIVECHSIGFLFYIQKV